MNGSRSLVLCLVAMLLTRADTASTVEVATAIGAYASHTLSEERWFRDRGTKRRVAA